MKITEAHRKLWPLLLFQIALLSFPLLFLPVKHGPSVHDHGGGDSPLGLDAYGLQFTALNLLSDLGSPFGTFGVKFIYEMDEVMGGQLGIKHYSKLEACMLALGAGGCVSSFLGYQLLPVLGLTSAAGYMYICSLYAFFVGMPIPPFFVVGVVSSLALGYRFRFFLDNPDDVSTAITFLVTVTGLTLLAGVIMAARNTEERKRFNRRFVKISKWCVALCCQPFDASSKPAALVDCNRCWQVR